MAFNRLIEKNLPNDGGRTSNGPRLVVIVPDQDLDVVSFSRTIHVLASPGVTDVLLMTVVHNFDSEMASRRRLATIGTLVRDFGYEVEAIAYWGRSWV